MDGNRDSLSLEPAQLFVLEAPYYLKMIVEEPNIYQNFAPKVRFEATLSEGTPLDTATLTTGATTSGERRIKITIINEADGESVGDIAPFDPATPPALPAMRVAGNYKIICVAVDAGNQPLGGVKCEEAKLTVYPLLFNAIVVNSPVYPSSDRVNIGEPFKLILSGVFTPIPSKPTPDFSQLTYSLKMFAEDTEFFDGDVIVGLDGENNPRLSFGEFNLTLLTGYLAFPLKINNLGTVVSEDNMPYESEKTRAQFTNWKVALVIKSANQELLKGEEVLTIYSLGRNASSIKTIHHLSEGVLSLTFRVLNDDGLTGFSADRLRLYYAFVRDACPQRIEALPTLNRANFLKEGGFFGVSLGAHLIAENERYKEGNNIMCYVLGLEGEATPLQMSDVWGISISP